MRLYCIAVAVLLLLALGIGQAVAATTVLWQEGFEGYNTKAGQTWGSLDRTDTTGPNRQSTNPWWGTPYEPNMFITKSMENPDPLVMTVNPHSGQFMARAAAGDPWFNTRDGDNSHVNLAYRFNNGQAFKDNFAVDWWFYDVLGNTYPDKPGDDWTGQGPNNFGDYVSLDYTATQAPTNKDTPTTQASYGDWNIGAQLAIGAIEDQDGFDTSVYQVFVQGNGLTNTTVGRTQGWHNAKISVDKYGTASFFIDSVLVDMEETNAVNGFNVLTMRGTWSTPGYYNQSAYYDDFTLAKIPEPGSMLAMASGLLGLLGFAKRRRH